MTRIGFIGLGHMGLPMAINLIKAGHEVTGFDLSAEALALFGKAGGHAAASLDEVAAGQAMIVTMLQTGEQVKQVCLGDKGFYQHGQSMLHIDCSSIDVQTAQTLHLAAVASGLEMIDAPVSGGVRGAEAGTLTLMVGGEAHILEKALPYLNILGKKIIHTGGAGTGQAAKICNNMILGISMIAVSEAFVLAEKLGLSPEKLFEVVTNSSGQCWSMSHYAPVPGLLADTPASHDYQPGFTAAMMLKDLKLSQQSAQAVHMETVLGAQATQIYQQFVEEGTGGLDFSAIIKVC